MAKNMVDEVGVKNVLCLIWQMFLVVLLDTCFYKGADFVSLI